MYALFSELDAANVEYNNKVSSGSNQQTLHSLAWNVDDLSRLAEEGRKLIVELRVVKTRAEGPEDEYLSSNVPRHLCVLRERLTLMLKGVYRFYRTAATHVLVIMISPEERTRKPYALPVQCIPYTSLTDKQCRQLTDKVISEMHKRRMKVSGM